MPDKKLINASNASSELRARAEKRRQIKQGAQAGPLPTPEEMLRMIHEFSVHQIELEMQQEELLQSREILEESLGRYTELYDHAPLGYLTLTRDCKILRANLRAAKMLGVDRLPLLGMNFKQFVVPDDYRVIEALLKKAFTERLTGSCVVTFVKEPLQHQTLAGKTVRIDAAISDMDYACSLILADITEQKLVEDELRTSERNCRSYAEHISELVYMTDANGFVTYATTRKPPLLGYLPTEAIGHMFTDFLVQDEIPEAVKIFHDILLHKQTKNLAEAVRDITVLIAEDDAMSTILLKKTLKDQNITILCAGNGQEAVEQVRQHPEIDLVLMDIQMPIMNGFDATKLIKAQRPDLPVIIQSALYLKR